jgi:hypothetical protein
MNDFYALYARTLVPYFFGLLYHKQWSYLGQFDKWEDAVGYAFNVCKLDDESQFTVKHYRRDLA